jgi:hypothetical protein
MLASTDYNAFCVDNLPCVIEMRTKSTASSEHEKNTSYIQQRRRRFTTLDNKNGINNLFLDSACSKSVRRTWLFKRVKECCG